MYVDAHAHLDKYEAELPEMVHEIVQNQIFTVSVSMDPSGYLKSRKTDGQCHWILSTFGVHPWEAPNFYTRLDTLDVLIDESPMVGEIGLDYHFVTETEKYPIQREVFRYFIFKGVAQGKVLNIHSTGAETDVNRILGELGARRVIVHWYSGSLEELSQLAEKGFYFTIGVEVLSSAHIQRIAQSVPEHLLLTETDNPGGLRWLTGEPGKPAIIKRIVDKISELRHWSHEETCQRILKNFVRLADEDEWASTLKALANPGY